MFFTINDPLDFCASLATYLGFLSLLGLYSLYDRLDIPQRRRMTRTLIWGLMVLTWVIAMADTTVLHLMPDDWWPEWGYVRRLIWRPTQAAITCWCYVDSWLWLRTAQKTQRSTAQKSGQQTIDMP